MRAGGKASFPEPPGGAESCHPPVANLVGRRLEPHLGGPFLSLLPPETCSGWEPSPAARGPEGRGSPGRRCAGRARPPAPLGGRRGAPGPCGRGPLGPAGGGSSICIFGGAGPGSPRAPGSGANAQGAPGSGEGLLLREPRHPAPSRGPSLLLRTPRSAPLVPAPPGPEGRHLGPFRLAAPSAPAGVVVEERKVTKKSSSWGFIRKRLLPGVGGWGVGGGVAGDQFALGPLPPSRFVGAVFTPVQYAVFPVGSARRSERSGGRGGVRAPGGAGAGAG